MALWRPHVQFYKKPFPGLSDPRPGKKAVHGNHLSAANQAGSTWLYLPPELVLQIADEETEAQRGQNMGEGAVSQSCVSDF